MSGAEDEGDSARAWARTGEEFSLLCVCVKVCPDVAIGEGVSWCCNMGVVGCGGWGGRAGGVVGA